MKIYIVTHEHNAEDLESCPNNIVSAHLSREKAEASLAREKKECLKEYWEGYRNDGNVVIDHDLCGLFEIHDNYSCDRDEILIHEEEIID